MPKDYSNFKVLTGILGGFGLGQRMRAPNHLGQAITRDMGINLGGLHITMTKLFLPARNIGR